MYAIIIMSYIDFCNKLKQYQPYEVEASKRISKLYNVKIVSFNNTNKYDFIDENNIKYEVKTEPSSLRTNNYFIEYFAYKKASGLSVSEAHYYIFCDTINYYMISIKKLKKIVKNCDEHRTKDGLTFGYLVKTSLINCNSTTI
jgi:hypothetical protein